MIPRCWSKKNDNSAKRLCAAWKYLLRWKDKVFNNIFRFRPSSYCFCFSPLLHLPKLTTQASTFWEQGWQEQTAHCGGIGCPTYFTLGIMASHKMKTTNFFSGRYQRVSCMNYDCCGTSKIGCVSFLNQNMFAWTLYFSAFVSSIWLVLWQNNELTSFVKGSWALEGASAGQASWHTGQPNWGFQKHFLYKFWTLEEFWTLNSEHSQNDKMTRQRDK